MAPPTPQISVEEEPAYVDPGYTVRQPMFEEANYGDELTMYAHHHPPATVSIPIRTVLRWNCGSFLPTRLIIRDVPAAC